VAGKPIIEHIVDELLSAGVDYITFVIGYLGTQIREHILTRYKNSKAVFDFVEQTEQKGLAHAIQTAKSTLLPDEPVIIVLGDTIFHVDFKKIVSSPESVLCVKQVEDARRFGVVEAKDGFAVRAVEKPEIPPSRLALVGLYKVRHSGDLFKAIDELFEKDIRTRGEFQLTDALDLMIRNGERMRVIEIDDWFDCGTADSVLATNRILLEKKSIGQAPADCLNLIIPPVHLDPTSQCENCVLGPYVTIGPGARLRNCVLKNTIVNSRAVVENLAAEDSLIGADATVTNRPRKLNIGDSTDVIL
jgi:glucose-1-phosphate thymidylyltransferase